MNKLTIKKFGPVKSVAIDLKKYNVIIGPQSSGKSCILKIASFCKWVEKRIELSQNPSHYLSEKTVETELLQFHKLNGFEKEGAFIKYESPFMQFAIIFKHKNEIEFEHQWKRNRWNYKRPTISYIPAERNIVAAIPNWFDVKLIHNNIRNYMSDWEESRQMFSKSNSLSILDLETAYYYNAAEKSDKIVIDKHGNSIEFTNASSGLQSIVPLFVLISFLTNKSTYKTGASSVANDRERDELAKIITNRSDLPQSLTSHEIIENLSKTQHVEIFLEEPEENIFPQTQYQLIKWIANQMLLSDDNSISITTHSPYILASLNNLIQAGEVFAEKNEKLSEIKKILGEGRYISYDQISVYSMNNGHAKSIKDKEFRLISQSALDSVSEDISRDFSKLLDIQ